MCQNCVRIEFPLLRKIFFFLGDSILVVFIFLLEKVFFYNEFHSYAKKAVHCNCTPYLQEFSHFLTNNLKSCGTTGDGFSE